MSIPIFQFIPFPPTLDFFFSVVAEWHVGSQFPNQGSNLHPLVLELWILNHWAARAVQGPSLVCLLSLLQPGRAPNPPQMLNLTNTYGESEQASAVGRGCDRQAHT